MRIGSIFFPLCLSDYYGYESSKVANSISDKIDQLKGRERERAVDTIRPQKAKQRESNRENQLLKLCDMARRHI